MAVVLAWPFKDPAEIADYDLDWSQRLGTDTIATSSWAITLTDAPASTAIAIGTGPHAPSNTASRTKVWLSGGTLGYTYNLQNTVTTANGDTLVETVKIQIKTK